ncbi:MAG TPA: hypothetical protein PLS34_10210, partial [Gammaproteobacteria bacterium]|nr:hypothetical protein [Gammaproteobacteria bacterium]
MAELLPSLRLDRVTHQPGDDCALIPTGKGFVELVFHFVRHAEIDGGHGPASIVENFNNIMDSSMHVGKHSMRSGAEKTGVRHPFRSGIETG